MLRLPPVPRAAPRRPHDRQPVAGHPRRFFVEPTEDFLHKAAKTLALLRGEVPDCGRHHVRTFLWNDAETVEPG